MANKQITHSFEGMMQDTSQSLFPNKFYFEGRNIRIVATDTQSTGSITNEKGNELILTLPNPIINYTNKTITYDNQVLSYVNDEINNLSPNQSGEQIIIGHSTNRNHVILFSTDNNGFDCIWKLEYDTFELTLIYLRNLGFNTQNLIQVINNFENEKIDKIYWVDGFNQMKFLNVNHSIVNGDVEELIDLPMSVVNMVGDYTFDEPKIIKTSKGGIHTSGMIQYAYNLYRLNSSQTKLSPLSELIPLDKGEAGGGDINEVVGTIPIIKISNLDTRYTHIKVYAIKYTSYNEIPSISLITDEYIPSNGEVDIFDDGKIISSVSLDEFLFLGSDIIVPNHINSKFNRLFFANYKEINFETLLDTRAYSFNSGQVGIVYNNVKLFETGDTTPNVNGITGEPRVISNTAFTNVYNEIFDSINLDYDVYKYQANGTTIGGEGKYIKYELVQDSIKEENDKYFKDDEIYRLGIQFYNKFGQITVPNWIADFKSREGNLEDNFNKLKVTLKPDFYVWLNTSSNFQTSYNKPVGYKILIAQRNIEDRTIVSNGIVSTMSCNDNSGTQVLSSQYVIDNSKKLPKLPNILLRNCDSNPAIEYGTSRPLKNAQNLNDFYESSSGENPGDEAQFAYFVDSDTSGRSWQFNSMMQMYSPEIIFGFTNSLTNNLRFKVKGAFKNSYNAAWIKESHLDGSEVSEGKVYDGISPHRTGGPTFTVKTIRGEASNLLSAGIIGHPTGSDPHHTETMLFYRNYGDLSTITDNYTIGGNAFPFQNNFTCFPNEGNIVFNLSKKLITIKLGETFGVVTGTYEGEVTFTVTPDPAYTGTLYNVKLCNDVNGVNIYTSTILSGVTGTQILNHSQTFTPSSFGTTYRNINYGIVLDSTSPFVGTIDVTVVRRHDSVDTDDCSSTGNTITVGPPTPISTVFYVKAPNKVYYNTYGAPEIAEVNQTFKSYNDDIELRYTNTLESFITDGDSDWEFMDDYNRAITSINCTNNRCATFVLDPLTPPISSNPVYRPTLEQMFVSSGIVGSDFGVIGEFIKNNEEIYLGNIYGGNSYESKRRTSYIEIGEYKDLSLSTTSFSQNNINYINSPGDTIVERFRFLRIIRKDTHIGGTNVREYEEIIEVPTETIVNLSNRNDDSDNNWDSSLSYLNDDYHSYNKVYSQQSDLIIRKNSNFNFKKVNNFDTNVIVSKVKVNNEIVDSWTDTLVNEVLTLDGKYGPINSLHNFKDELYAIQDTALAFLSILPRVQLQSSDGIGIELGEGNVLQRYKYLSIEEGTKNKWSVTNSPNTFYFYDILNNSIQACSGKEIGKVLDLKGMHSYFIKNIDKQSLLQNNPTLLNGVVSEYDYINNEVFFTFLQSEKPSFTLSYNELTKSFISFYDYIPTRYISRGDNFLALKNNNNQLYKQYAGEYNKFFDVYYPSYITLNVNPEADKDCVFDNINFKSEVYLNNIDVPDKTINNIRAYNDYQDSGTVPLIFGRNDNLRRKFRDWNAFIPRQNRNRIRGPYSKLKLGFTNTNNYKLILHPIIIYYTI